MHEVFRIENRPGRSRTCISWIIEWNPILKNKKLSDTESIPSKFIKLCEKEHVDEITLVSITLALCPWWRRQMETFSAHWPFVWEFTGDRWIPLTKASDAELWCFLWSVPEYKRLSKQSWDWWFETPSRSLWRHCNASSKFPTRWVTRLHTHVLKKWSCRGYG